MESIPLRGQWCESTRIKEWTSHRETDFCDKGSISATGTTATEIDCLQTYYKFANGWVSKMYQKTHPEHQRTPPEHENHELIKGILQFCSANRFPCEKRDRRRPNLDNKMRKLNLYPNPNHLMGVHA